jgi:uncharacterized protein (TIGR03435 family)
LTLPGFDAHQIADNEQGVRRTDIGEPVPSIFTALQEQLVLELKSAPVALDVLVVDHVERPNSDLR